MRTKKRKEFILLFFYKLSYFCTSFQVKYIVWFFLNDKCFFCSLNMSTDAKSKLADARPASVKHVYNFPNFYFFIVCCISDCLPILLNLPLFYSILFYLPYRFGSLLYLLCDFLSVCLTYVILLYFSNVILLIHVSIIQSIILYHLWGIRLRVWPFCYILKIICFYCLLCICKYHIKRFHM